MQLRTILLTASLLGTSACAVDFGSAESAVTSEPNQVIAWNKVLTTAIAAQNPPFQSRQATVVHAAVFDAVQGIEKDYKFYEKNAVKHIKRPKGATANAAAAGAAHYALTHLNYTPPLNAAQQAAINDAWNNLPESIKNNPGVAYGEAVAAAILDVRSTDGAPTAPQSPYHAPGEGQPGVWLTPPTGTALVPTWGAQTPWVLDDALAFSPGAPVALDSATMQADVAEIHNQVLTPLQLDVAKYWQVAAPVVWNVVARELATNANLSVSESSRVFFTMNAAEADAAIAGWNLKYKYNLWRPIHAIRAAGDTTWNPAIPTPPFPEYCSGHASLSGASTKALINTFGDVGASRPPAPQFTSLSTPFPSLSVALQEVNDARVWGGIHYRHTDDVCAVMGQQIADYTDATLAQPRDDEGDDE